MADGVLNYCVVYYPCFYSVVQTPAPCITPSAKSLNCGTSAASTESRPSAETTLKVRQLHPKWRARNLASFLMDKIGATFDFIYVPLDFTTRRNYRFGFVNFFTEAEAQSGKRVLESLGLEPSLARVQGFSDNIEKLLNSPINVRDAESQLPLRGYEDGLPLLFARNAEGQVEQMPFPPPTKPLPHMKSKSKKAKARAFADSCGGRGSANSKKVFISGFSALEKVNRQDVEAALCGFGPVASVRVMSGYGFVEFDDPEAAAEAVKFGETRELQLIEGATGASASFSIKQFVP